MAVRFDASGDYLQRTTDLPGITAFTVMGWFYISVDRNAYSCFAAYGDTGPSVNEYYFMGTANDGTTFNLWNGIASVSGTGLSVGAWNHIAMTVAGTGADDFLGYLNGVLNITHDGNAAISNQRLVLADDPFAERFNGRAFAIKCWSDVLSAAEIAREIYTIRPQRFANQHAWWPLLPGATERLRDYSGNGRDWTAGGALADEDPPPVPWGFTAPTYGTSTTVAAVRRIFITHT